MRRFVECERVVRVPGVDETGIGAGRPLILLDRLYTSIAVPLPLSRRCRKRNRIVGKRHRCLSNVKL